MASINEIKEKMTVVKSVGGFANALQQIATMRMLALRTKVLASKRFVDEATAMLREMNFYKEIHYTSELQKANKNSFGDKKKKEREQNLPKTKALIVVSSNQGLCGKFNAEIFKRLEEYILRNCADSDIFMIGKKGQEHYLSNKKYQYKFYPYDLPDNFSFDHLLRLVNMFPYYDEILMVYTRFVNTMKRDVVEAMLVAPPTGALAINDEETIEFIFEPSLDELINDAQAKLRAASFQQQILDSRLAQFSAQMVGMQAASENSKILLDDLGHEYNKQRRKLIDKKISEVLAGKALW